MIIVVHLLSIAISQTNTFIKCSGEFSRCDGAKQVDAHHVGIGAPDVPQVDIWKTNDWSLNLGATVGRVGPIGGRPMQIYGGVYYNTEENDNSVSSEWVVKLNVGFLFPG